MYKRKLLSFQIAKKNQYVFMTDGCNIVGLFQAGVISLGMPESPTVKASCSFLVSGHISNVKSEIIIAFDVELRLHASCNVSNVIFSLE